VKLKDAIKGLGKNFTKKELLQFVDDRKDLIENHDKKVEEKLGKLPIRTYHKKTYQKRIKIKYEE